MSRDRAPDLVVEQVLELGRSRCMSVSSLGQVGGWLPHAIHSPFYVFIFKSTHKTCDHLLLVYQVRDESI